MSSHSQNFKVSYLSQEELGFVCKSNSYGAYPQILWINIRSARTALSLRCVVQKPSTASVQRSPSTFLAQNIFQAIRILPVNKAATGQDCSVKIQQRNPKQVILTACCFTCSFPGHTGSWSNWEQKYLSSQRKSKIQPGVKWDGKEGPGKRNSWCRRPKARLKVNVKEFNMRGKVAMRSESEADVLHYSSVWGSGRWGEWI